MKIISIGLLIVVCSMIVAGSYELIISVMKNDGSMFFIAGIVLSVGGVFALIENKVRKVVK